MACQENIDQWWADDGFVQSLLDAGCDFGQSYESSFNNSFGWDAIPEPEGFLSGDDTTAAGPPTALPETQQEPTLTHPKSLPTSDATLPEPQKEQQGHTLALPEPWLGRIDPTLTLPGPREEQQVPTLTLPKPPTRTLPEPRKEQQVPTLTLPKPPLQPTTTLPTPAQSPAANNKRKADSPGPSSAEAPKKKKRKVLSGDNNACAECQRKKIACKPAEDGSSGRCAGCARRGVECERNGLDGRTHKSIAAASADEVAAFKRTAMSIVYLLWLSRTGRLTGPMLGTVRVILDASGPRVACPSAAASAMDGPESVLARIGEAAGGGGCGGCDTWPRFVWEARRVAQGGSGEVKLKERRRSLEDFRAEARDFLMRLRAVLAASIGDLPDGLPEGALVAVGQVIWPHMHTRPHPEMLADLARNAPRCPDGPDCAGYSDWAHFTSEVMEKARNPRFRENGDVKELAERECFKSFRKWADVKTLAELAKLES